MGLFTSAEEKERKKQEAAKAKRDEFITKYHLEEYAGRYSGTRTQPDYRDF